MGWFSKKEEIVEEVYTQEQKDLYDKQKDEMIIFYIETLDKLSNGSETFVSVYWFDMENPFDKFHYSVRLYIPIINFKSEFHITYEHWKELSRKTE